MTRSTKWFLGIIGVLAVVAALFIIAFLAIMSSSTDRIETVTSGGGGGRIAVVELQGVINSSDDIVRQLKKYRKDGSIEAILLRIDSPGGAVVPSQEMYEEVRKTREGGKPVIVSMGSLAASGGYYVACGGSRLVANAGTLTGSIGVISEFLQLHDALQKLGIDVKTIKSGELKDAGSPTRPMTDEDQRYFQGLMDDVRGQFVSVVERERNLSKARVEALADGRAFTGVQAVKEGLVDTIGTFEDAVKIAAGMAGIRGEPTLVRERRRRGLLESLFQDASEAVRDVKQDVLDRPVLSYQYTGPF